MMPDAPSSPAGLYRDVLLRHAKNPEGAAVIPPDAPDAVRKVNPACGDEVRLRLVKDADGRILRLEHQTRGCAVCIASASMMAHEVNARGGMSPADALARCAEVSSRLATGDFSPADGPLQALAPLARYPARIACARLALEAFAAALPAPTEK